MAPGEGKATGSKSSPPGSDTECARLPRPISPYLTRSLTGPDIYRNNRTISRPDRQKTNRSGVKRRQGGGDRCEGSESSQDSLRESTDISHRSSSTHLDRSSASSVFTDQTRTTSSRGEGHQTRRERKEVRSLSKTVENKLTYFVNAGQRENSFSPLGHQVTTYKMLPYDVQYKCIEAEMDKATRRKNKQNERNGKSHRILPILDKQATPMVLDTQVARITQYANEIFDSVPALTLALIHRYRPHSPDVKKLPQNGDVQNYNCHIGSALHTKNYVDFYIRHGLHTGNKEKSPRLQSLRQKKINEEKKATQKPPNRTKRRNTPSERPAEKTRTKKDNSKTGSKFYGKSSFNKNAESEVGNDNSDDVTASRDLSSRASSRRLESESTTPNPRSTSVSDDQEYSTDGQSRDADGQSRDTDGQSRDTDGQSRDADGQSRDTDGQSRDADSRSRDTDGQSRDADNQSRDTDSRSRDTDGRSRDTDSRSRDIDAQSRNTDAQSRDYSDDYDEAEDTVSTQTYLSVEHASRLERNRTESSAKGYSTN